MYFLRRICFALPLLLVISLLSFGILKIAPGGPFDKERKPASPEIERNLAHKYHLDEPFWKQYLRYLGVGYERDAAGQTHWFQGGLVRGDFGPSYKYRDHSVNDIIRQGFPVSMSLGCVAFCLALGTGVPLGFFTAVNRAKWVGYAGTFLVVLCVCIPGLVIAPLLIMVFALKWRLLPVALWESPAHMILPSVALGLYFSGRIARLMREGMLGVMNSEFLTAARSKGMSETRLMIKHGLRMAILPVVSYSGPLLADLLTGSFIVETIFQIPGIGVPMVSSMLNKDYTLAIGLVLLYATLLVGLNLLVDLVYSLFDRRVRYE